MRNSQRVQKKRTRRELEELTSEEEEEEEVVEREVIPQRVAGRGRGAPSSVTGTSTSGSSRLPAAPAKQPNTWRDACKRLLNLMGKRK